MITIGGEDISMEESRTNGSKFVPAGQTVEVFLMEVKFNDC
jgi:hypothetical protein